MSLPCDTESRLAAPVGTTPIQCVPPTGAPPSSEFPGTAFLEPSETSVPGYLATARAQARAVVSPAAFARLAQAELSAEDKAAAVSAATQVLELTASSPDTAAEFAAVQVLRAGGAPDTSRRLLQPTTADDHVGKTMRARLAIECGDFEDAQALLENVSTFDGLFMQGWLAMRHGKYDRAIALLRGAARVAGPTPDVLVNMGYSYAVLGHLRQAIAVTRQAQALAPHNRLVAFNLVNSYLAVGDYGAATDALDPLRKLYPDDVEIALALAHIALREGDQGRAHRLLQRMRTSQSWVSAPLVRRAELESNLALLRWLTGRNTLAEYRATVLQQLEVSDYQSLSMASLLPTLLPKFSDEELFATLLQRFEEHHKPTALFQLRVHGAVLRKDETAAVTLAVDWVREHPLNPIAAAVAMQLMGALTADAGAAIDLGYEALKRSPADLTLVNNLAFALALAGRVRQARIVLARITVPVVPPAVLATRGLVELLSGNVRAGIRGYDQARQLAEKQRNKRLGELATLNLELWLRRADPVVLRRCEIDTTAPVEFPISDEDDAAVWLLAKRARREGVEIEWVEDRIGTEN